MRSLTFLTFLAIAIAVQVLSFFVFVAKSDPTLCIRIGFFILIDVASLISYIYERRLRKELKWKKELREGLDFKLVLAKVKVAEAEKQIEVVEERRRAFVQKWKKRFKEE